MPGPERATILPDESSASTDHRYRPSTSPGSASEDGRHEVVQTSTGSRTGESPDSQRERDQTPQHCQDVPWTGILDMRAPAHGRMKRFLGWVRNADWLSHAAVVPSCPSRRNGSARLPLCTIGRERRVPHGCPPGTGCRAPTACHASASNLAYHLPESPTDGRSRGEIGIARAEHRPCGVVIARAGIARAGVGTKP